MSRVNLCLPPHHRLAVEAEDLTNNLCRDKRRQRTLAQLSQHSQTSKNSYQKTCKRKVKFSHNLRIISPQNVAENLHFIVLVQYEPHPLQLQALKILEPLPDLLLTGLHPVH